MSDFQTLRDAFDKIGICYIDERHLSTDWDGNPGYWRYLAPVNIKDSVYKSRKELEDAERVAFFIPRYHHFFEFDPDGDLGSY